jgi:hypothetical protein
MCHGIDLKATGPLANKSNPPAPDLKLMDYAYALLNTVLIGCCKVFIPQSWEVQMQAVPCPVKSMHCCSKWFEHGETLNTLVEET